MIDGRFRRATGALLGLFAGAATLAVATPHAEAGGYDWPGIGTRGMGRAGAWAARADSPIALHLNPANLARVPGITAELSMHLSSFNACFDRTGTPLYSGEDDPTTTDDDRATVPDPGDADFDNYSSIFGHPADYQNIQYPEICNERGIGVVPQLALSIPVHDRVSIGIGLVAPNQGGSHRQFGSTQEGRLGAYNVPGSPTGELASPMRYDLVEADVLLAWATIGAGVEVIPNQLWVGLTFGWGFAHTGFTTIISPGGGEDYNGDLSAEVDANDFFVPRISASVSAQPIQGLDVMAGFSFSANVEATGTITNTGALYATNPEFMASTATNKVRLRAPQVPHLRFAARYGMPRSSGNDTPPEERDPMTDELFDIELDLDVAFGQRVDSFDVKFTADLSERERVRPGIVPLAIAPGDVSLPHNWKNQVMIAVGSDINVAPGVFALRLGMVYESHGVQAGWERLDFTPWQRIAGTFGFTARIERFELSLAYMYMHWFTVNNSESDANVEQVLPTELELHPPTRINAGRYKINANVISLGLQYRFN